jgi:hypothetical protein
MKWARRSPSSVQRPAFRPRLEALEDRHLLNVSSVFDSAGNLTQFVVEQGGALLRYDNAGGHVLASSGVRVVHAFRDLSGQVGLDVVYSSGLAFEYDSTGGRFMGSQILNMSRAYDAKGNFKLDVLYDTTDMPPFGNDLKGTLVEYTNTSVMKLADNVRWVSNYVDPNGGLGIAVGMVVTGGNLVAFRSDSTGSTPLYDAPDGSTQDVTDYSQAEDLGGHVWVDVTFGRFAGTYALEYRPTGVMLLGSSTSIQVGG